MKIQENIPLAQYTTLKVGGPAKFFCEPENEKEILEAVKFAEEKKLPVFVLGGGSNLLVSDKGFEGLVIKMNSSVWRLNLQNGGLASIATCGAGVLLGKLVSESAKASLTGLEWAAGIPGTVGGAVWGNAGAFGGEMALAIESVRALEIPIFSKVRPFPSSSEALGIPQGRTFYPQDCEFGYRESIFKKNPNLLILSAVLKLKKGDKAEIEQKVKEILKQRKAVQPHDFPSSGSFFKNPIVKDKKLIEEFKKETGSKAVDGKIPAGYLIDELNLRGKKIGGAMVSQKHGNFLVNAGGAKAEDFVILAAVIKTRVRNKFGIQLKEEVQMVGF